MNDPSRRQALVALALLVPAPSIGTLAAMVFDLGFTGQVIYGLSKVWLAVFPLIWLLVVEKRKISWSPISKGGLLTGAALGIVISAIILITYVLLGDQLIDPATVRATASENDLDVTWRFVGLAVYLITVNSLLEEYVWRWFVFRRSETIVSGAGAVLLSALFFTIHHVIALRAQMPWTPALLCSLGVFIGGAAWSWCYLKFRSIWPGYLSHAIVDLAILYIGWQLIFQSAA